MNKSTKTKHQGDMSGVVELGPEELVKILAQENLKLRAALRKIADLEKCLTCEVCAPCGLGMFLPRKLALQALG